MSQITIPKREYQELLNAKMRYEYLKQVIDGELFSPPPVGEVEEIIRGFKAVGKYNKKFLDSLERGLKRSTRFKK